MSEILKRDKDGNVELTNLSFKVSTDRTALSLFIKGNKFIPDSEFCEDGYIHVNGKPVSKWFISLGGWQGSTIWEPKLNNISLLEEKRWRTYQYAKQFELNNSDKIQELIKSNTPFVGNYKAPKHEGDVYFRQLYENSDSFCWNWVETPTTNFGVKKEDYPRRQDLCNAWFKYEKRSFTLWHRFGKTNNALMQAIKKQYIEKLYAMKITPCLHLSINKRDYWIKINKNREFYLEFIGTPEDTITEIL